MSSTPALTFAGGAVIGFEVDADIIDAVRDRMAFARAVPSVEKADVVYRAGRGRRGRVFVRHDDQRVDRTESVGGSIDELIDDLHLTIALHATDEVFVHAGVIEWKGSAVLMPGRSHAGKSTLVHALVSAGATYCSDEYARITMEGRVATYPRPIHLRTPSGRQLVDPSTIGEVAALDQPLPVGLIVFTAFESGAMFDPQPMSGAQAALELLDNTVIADVDPTRAARTVALIGRSAVAVRSPRPDATTVAGEILDLADELVPAA